MFYYVTHTVTRDKLHVDLDIPVLSINNQKVDTLDVREIEFLCLLIGSSPKALQYNDIIERLLIKHKIEVDYSDPLLYIRKKKHNIVKSIQLLTNNDSFPPLIDTVRGVGYRLNSGWVLENTQEGIQAIIDKIGHILEDTIVLEESIPLCNLEGEDTNFIVLNTDGYSLEIGSLQKKYLTLAEKLLDSLNLSPFESKFVLIESVLRLIRSYTAMSRQGKDITYDEWRTMFKDELQQHFRSLVMLLQV